MVNMVGVKTTLNNNCSLRVDSDAEVVYVNVPKLEGDNVYFNTNSSFSKIEKIIDYKWPKNRNTNWLTVHQSKPYIAYVLYPDFQETNRLSRSVEELDPAKQIIRIFNYNNQKRMLLKPQFSTTIADLAFAYVTMSSNDDDKFAVVDRFANVIIYSCYLSDDDPNGYKSCELLKIVSEVGVPFSEVRLAWCPGYIDDDYGMNLAISYDNTIEVYDAGRFIERGFCHISKEELELSTPERKLIKEAGCEPIITVALSNDLAMICSASKDNRVRFYQFEDEEVRLVHTWEPKWSSDGNLSCVFFLDDFNELIKDQESGIWGYIFVGTSNGEITIWESNLWRPIQKVVLCFPDDEPSNITYRIDLSSHVILAIQEKTGFLLHLEFLDVDNCGLGGDGKALLVKQPRIKKITRFQIYNPILSFTVKRPNPSQIEIFWLTQKTIEKCLVEIENLVIDENAENNFLARYNLSNINQDYDQNRSLIYPNMSINGADDESVDDESSKRSLPSYEVTPPVTLASIFNNISTLSESGTSGLTAVGGSSSKNQSGDIKLSGSHQIMGDSITQRPTSSPTSREVANYLDDEKVHRNPSSKIYDEMLHLEPQPEMNVPPKILNIDTRVQHSMSSVPFEPLPKDLAKEGMIKELETNLLDRFDIKMDNIKSEMTKITNDIESLRNEVKDPSQLKAANKIVDILIKKLMHQMNQMFAKGLEEFMQQIRSEIAPTVNTLNQCRNDLNAHCSSVGKQFKQCETQIQELRKEVAECSKHQADILAQLRFQQQQFQAVISPSPTALRSHHLMNVTPTPNKQPFSPLVIYQAQEEEKRKKAEAERVARLQQMWNKIRSNDRTLMIEGICQAFEMRDPALINQICDHFRTTKGAAFLVELIAHDQALLLSILSTLASADLKEERWKIPFITSIVPRLDIKSPLISDWLPRFETKLVSRLEEAHKVLGNQASDIPLVLTILNLLRNQKNH